MIFLVLYNIVSSHKLLDGSHRINNNIDKVTKIREGGNLEVCNLSDKFRKDEECRIAYSKLYIPIVILGGLFFGICASVLFLGTDFSKSDTANRYAIVANMMVDHSPLRWGAGVFMLCFSAISVFIIIRVAKEKRPYLIFACDGLLISNLMPVGYPLIPWVKVKKYHVTSCPYTWWKYQISLDVDNYAQYTKSWIGLHAKPNILIFMGTAKLHDITLLLDQHISNSKNDEKN